MGRGVRTVSPLALTPLPPLRAYELEWLDAFTKVEHLNFHASSKPGLSVCDIPLPHGAPRFAVFSTNDPVNNAPEVHTFSYYTTLEELLTALVANIRTPAPDENYVLEHRPATNTFAFVEPLGASSGYTPPIVKPNKHRAGRLHAITFKHGMADTTADLARFACITRSGLTSDYHLSLQPSLRSVEIFGGSLAYFSSAFVNLYDLDISDQPVPIRFSLRYTDTSEATFEIAEPV